MAGSKGLYIRKAVCHLTANRIVVFKTGILRFPFIYFFHDLTEPVQRLCRLGEKTNITAEIQTVQVFYLFNHNGRTISLADKAVYFGMSFFTVNHQLCIIFTRLLITFMYLPLQLEHDRTRCIDDRYLILLCNLVGRRRFSMCTKQDFFPFQPGKSMVIDSA